MKSGQFKRKTYEEVLALNSATKLRKASLTGATKRVLKPKRELMPARIKRAKAKLEKISHDFVRRRDSKVDDRLAGNCVDCGLWTEGGQFQAGHFESSGGNGAWLRYHPRNMHGQAGGCNMARSQEKVKISYTLKMIDKYGREYVDYLRSYKQISIKADIYYYESLYNMYQNGTEEQICEWLDDYGKQNRLN